MDCSEAESPLTVNSTQAFASGLMHCQRQPPGEPLNPIYVQTMVRNDGAHPGQMVCRNRPAKDGDYKLVLTL